MKDARLNTKPEQLIRTGRTKPNRNAPTAWRTPQPMTPEGEEAARAITTGSMGAFGSKT